jgi:hypothetical protein
MRKILCLAVLSFLATSCSPEVEKQQESFEYGAQNCQTRVYSFGPELCEEELEKK